MTSRTILWALPMAALLLGGCATDRDDGAKLVSDETWQRLKAPLDADAAAQIALRNRPDLHAGTQPAVRFVAEAKAAFYSYQGDWELELRLKRILAAVPGPSEQASNANKLDLLNLRAQAARTQMAIADAQKIKIADREKLNRLMGLSMAAIVWVAKPGLPPLPARDPGTAELQFLALDQRSDLQALRREGGGAVALRALEVEIGSEVREASRTMFIDRQQVELCRRTLLPLNAQIVKETESAAGPASEIFLARQRELDDVRDYAAAWRDYWIAHAKLEAAVGGEIEPRR